jgi:hypothetical protein
MIKTRLETEVPELAEVKIMDNLGDILNRKIYPPSAFIVYGGYEITTASSTGVTAKIDIKWDIILALQGLQWAEGGVGALYTKVFQSLLGWKPDFDLGTVELQDPRLGTELQNGVAFAPLSFSVATYVHGKGD